MWAVRETRGGELGATGNWSHGVSLASWCSSQHHGLVELEVRHATQLPPFVGQSGGHAETTRGWIFLACTLDPQGLE